MTFAGVQRTIGARDILSYSIYQDSSMPLHLEQTDARSNTPAEAAEAAEARK